MSDVPTVADDRPVHPAAMAAALLVALIGGALAVLVVLSVFGFTDLI